MPDLQEQTNQGAGAYAAVVGRPTRNIADISFLDDSAMKGDRLAPDAPNRNEFVAATETRQTFFSVTKHTRPSGAAQIPPPRHVRVLQTFPTDLRQV